MPFNALSLQNSCLLASCPSRIAPGPGFILDTAGSLLKESSAGMGQTHTWTVLTMGQCLNTVYLGQKHVGRREKYREVVWHYSCSVLPCMTSSIPEVHSAAWLICLYPTYLIKPHFFLCVLILLSSIYIHTQKPLIFFIKLPYPFHHHLILIPGYGWAWTLYPGLYHSGLISPGKQIQIWAFSTWAIIFRAITGVFIVHCPPMLSNSQLAGLTNLILIFFILPFLVHFDFLVRISLNTAFPFWASRQNAAECSFKSLSMPCKLSLLWRFSYTSWVAGKLWVRCTL